jgi:hypothetical protein
MKCRRGASRPRDRTILVERFPVEERLSTGLPAGPNSRASMPESGLRTLPRSCLLRRTHFEVFAMPLATCLVDLEPTLPTLTLQHMMPRHGVLAIGTAGRRAGLEVSP